MFGITPKSDNVTHKAVYLAKTFELYKSVGSDAPTSILPRVPGSTAPYDVVILRKLLSPMQLDMLQLRELNKAPVMKIISQLVTARMINSRELSSLLAVSISTANIYTRRSDRAVAAECQRSNWVEDGSIGSREPLAMYIRVIGMAKMGVNLETPLTRGKGSIKLSSGDAFVTWGETSVQADSRGEVNYLHMWSPPVDWNAGALTVTKSVDPRPFPVPSLPPAPVELNLVAPTVTTVTPQIAPAPVSPGPASVSVPSTAPVTSVDRYANRLGGVSGRGGPSARGSSGASRYPPVPAHLQISASLESGRTLMPDTAAQKRALSSLSASTGATGSQRHASKRVSIGGYQGFTSLPLQSRSDFPSGAGLQTGVVDLGTRLDDEAMEEVKEGVNQGPCNRCIVLAYYCDGKSLCSHCRRDQAHCLRPLRTRPPISLGPARLNQPAVISPLRPADRPPPLQRSPFSVHGSTNKGSQPPPPPLIADSPVPATDAIPSAPVSPNDGVSQQRRSVPGRGFDPLRLSVPRPQMRVTGARPEDQMTGIEVGPEGVEGRARNAVNGNFGSFFDSDSD